MEWKYVKPLQTERLITSFENLVKYKFPEEFRKTVLLYNGGRPQYKTFDTEQVRERALKSFLSFNENDRETVWKIHEWNRDILGERFVPFAIDNFGNLICFEAKNSTIVFLNHENGISEKIADCFDDFLRGLYL